jgi:threonine synthase
MDILISSNLERLLLEVCGDPVAVRTWSEELHATGRFEADRDTMAAIGEEFTGGMVTNDEALTAIQRMYEETGYLFDPHTAVAWEVAGRERGRDPVIVVSTAHWAKFGADVYRALSGIGFEEPLPAAVQAFTPSQLLEEIVRLAPAQSIPDSLTDLDRIGDTARSPLEADPDTLRTAIDTWLEYPESV